MSDIDTSDDSVADAHEADADFDALEAEQRAADDEDSIAAGDEDAEARAPEPRRDAQDRRKPLNSGIGRELRQERQRRQALERRLEALERGGRQAYAEPDPIEALLAVDENEDPIGAIAASKALARAIFEERQADSYSAEQQRQERELVQGVWSRLADSETDFAEDTLDYPNAASHLRTALTEDLRAMGYAGQQLDAAVAQEVFGLTQRALAAGKDPAEVVYAVARRRGFGVDKAQGRIDTVARGQQASRSLSSSGARQGSGGLDVRTVANAPDKDFDRQFEALKRQEKSRRPA